MQYITSQYGITGFLMSHFPNVVTLEKAKHENHGL